MIGTKEFYLKFDDLFFGQGDGQSKAPMFEINFGFREKFKVMMEEYELEVWWRSKSRQQNLIMPQNSRYFIEINRNLNEKYIFHRISFFLDSNISSFTLNFKIILF